MVGVLRVGVMKAWCFYLLQHVDSFHGAEFGEVFDGYLVYLLHAHMNGH